MEVKAFSNEKYFDREPQGNLEVTEILTVGFFFAFFWDVSYLVILRKRIKMSVCLIYFLFSHIKI